MASIVVTALTALLAGCGPTAQERRACEMFVEAGGGKERGLAFWEEHWRKISDRVIQANPDANRDETYAFNAALAREMARDEEAKNKAAKAFVGLRLTMSLQEVDRVLKECSAAK